MGVLLRGMLRVGGERVQKNARAGRDGLQCVFGQLVEGGLVSAARCLVYSSRLRLRRQGFGGSLLSRDFFRRCPEPLSRPRTGV